MNTRKVTAFLQGAKVTMLKIPGSQSDGFVHSVREEGSPVNVKFENVTEALQFKRWFGDWQKIRKRQAG